VVDGLHEPEERLEVYRRVRAFREHPYRLMGILAEDTLAFGDEVIRARELLPDVELTPSAEQLTLHLVRDLEIASHRAEITTLEAARAYAAADSRQVATDEDVIAVAPMALRQRRSAFIQDFFRASDEEDAEIEASWRRIRGDAS
jgi:Mg-chelatase subunit ChlI